MFIELERLRHVSLSLNVSLIVTVSAGAGKPSRAAHTNLQRLPCRILWHIHLLLLGFVCFLPVALFLIE